MLIDFFNWFVKITAYPVQKLIFRTKVYYQDKNVQSRHIKGAAIVISNHTSVFDYAVYLFVFFTRTLRVQMAEVLFDKKPLGLFLKMLGGIYVNRDVHNFDFINKSEEILRKGGVVGAFPESRIPRGGEQTPLEFKPSTAYLALSADVPVVPAFTNGKYFCRERARVIIGTPMKPSDFFDDKLSDKENIDRFNNALRKKIIELRNELFSFKNIVIDFVRITGGLPVLLILRPKKRFASEKAKQKLRGGALIIANHTDYVDPVYLMSAFWYRRHHFIASEEVMDSKAGGFLRACGCIRIDRNNVTMNTLRKITDKLKQGEIVSMFPQGRISSGGDEGASFKSGMVLMAIRSGAPIVPVYIKPKKSFFSRLHVVVGERVSVTELYGERPTFAQIDAAAKLLYEREEQLKNLVD